MADTEQMSYAQRFLAMPNDKARRPDRMRMLKEGNVEELGEIVAATTPDDRWGRAAEAFLNARAVTESTRGMTKATWLLVAATWALLIGDVVVRLLTD